MACEIEFNIRTLPEATRNLLFPKVQEALERFSNSMQPVFEYENTTYPFCRSVLISIWDPESIPMCEEKYRLRLLKTNDGGDSYENFQILSSRLLDVVASLLDAINVRMYSYLFPLEHSYNRQTREILLNLSRNKNLPWYAVMEEMLRTVLDSARRGGCKNLVTGLV